MGEGVPAIFQDPIFQNLYDRSELRDKGEAVSREFFLGKREYSSPLCYVQVTEPALTPKAMQRRAQDSSFCLRCFSGDHEHYPDCSLSPWRTGPA